MYAETTTACSSSLRSVHRNHTKVCFMPYILSTHLCRCNLWVRITTDLNCLLELHALVFEPDLQLCPHEVQGMCNSIYLPPSPDQSSILPTCCSKCCETALGTHEGGSDLHLLVRPGCNRCKRWRRWWLSRRWNTESTFSSHHADHPHQTCCKNQRNGQR